MVVPDSVFVNDLLEKMSSQQAIVNGSVFLLTTDYSGLVLGDK